jgi:hypothetical protein
VVVGNNILNPESTRRLLRNLSTLGGVKYLVVVRINVSLSRLLPCCKLKDKNEDRRSLLAVHGEEASAIPAGLRPLHQAGALRHLTHPRGQVRDVDEEVLRPRQAVAPRAPQQPQQSRPAAAGVSQHRQRRPLEVSIRIFHMNYRLDVASLIVDPKGFPTR